ncbi:MAG TPA: DUF6159 family protein [Verrucomicrobiae bacterium]|nr:DUF6159 family protein [Verrucomicrobiae bacterium]
MGKLSRSWDLVGKSFGILLSDKELLYLPIASGIACLAVSVMMLAGYALAFPAQISAFAATSGAHQSPVTQGMWAYLFFFYLVNYFIVVFFNVALVAAASDRLAGGNATINYGLQVAWRRKGKIFQWALLAATVGILLRALEQRLGWLGRLVTKFIGVAWTMATFFVVPLLAAEDIGPAEALVRSGELFTETWGEQLIGGFSFGLIFVLLALPGIALPFLLRSPLGSSGVLMGVILMIVYWLLLSVVSAAVQGIFMAALYRYATTKEVPPTFHLSDFSTAWQPKD